ncbi:flavodoxin [Lactobacillus selangorensis]|uniref:Flavodoxin n=1 Tax=Lactobacillus selangorensis TaxID=81857 RepID=A0A0R2FX33_9LACO|nr:flavodoxin [Lactobacillus selangorensis]KRN28690.1 flavodoxin [Lactobacillus selangorensis]KRN32899.1 flavodoxin [Lactobacillus selangorensis]
MKRKIGVILAFFAALLTLGLQFQSQGETAQAATSKKSLILYFSTSGNTKKAAEKLQQDTGAKLVRIEPVKAYPADYDGTVKMARQQLKKKRHPAIKTKIPDLDKYDTIYIGFPTWWQQPPMIIHTLFDQENFSGKTIVPFTTSMSTPISASTKYIRKMAKKDQNVTVESGFRYDDNNAAMKRYLKQNNLN